jgi:transcriptional regulator with XRE-family HTH domain
MSENVFGAALKEWRAKRRFSQLELGLAAQVSARHIAFLETGRARPSRSMVMQLGEALAMPRSERNRLLDSAGFRVAWKRRPLDEKEMAPVKRAMLHMITRHDPYPAFVIDRHWTIVMANQTGGSVLSAFGIAAGGSLIEAMLDPGRAQAMIENWPDVAAHLLARLRTESLHHGGDPVLDAAARRLENDPALARHHGRDHGRNHGRDHGHGDMPAVIPARYRIGGQLFSVFTTIAQFGTAEDMALADLRIELLFPADDETEQLFAAMGRRAD